MRAEVVLGVLNRIAEPFLLPKEAAVLCHEEVPGFQEDEYSNRFDTKVDQLTTCFPHIHKQIDAIRQAVEEGLPFASAIEQLEQLRFSAAVDYITEKVLEQMDNE